MSVSTPSDQSGDSHLERLKFRMELHDEVDSTNERVKDALRAGEAEGLVVCARRQSGGYGRQGRSWSSPEGGLYLSLLLRPDVPLAQLPTLSLVVGLAVREAIAGLVASENVDSIKVKWPNDVVHANVGDRIEKLCGISLERVANGVCAGIGINVFPPTATALEGKNDFCCLLDLGMDSSTTLNDVRDAVLREFVARYGLWCAEAFAPFCASYTAHALLTGKHVTIEDLDGIVTVEGRVEGVDEDGHLLVSSPDGTTHAVSSGEAHISTIS